MIIGAAIYSDDKRRVLGYGAGLVLRDPSQNLFTASKISDHDDAEDRLSLWLARKIAEIKTHIDGSPLVVTGGYTYPLLDPWLPEVTVKADEESDVYVHAYRQSRAALYGVSLSSSTILVGNPVSSKRAQYLHMQAKESGYTEMGIRLLLSEYGIVSTKEVTTHIFRSVLMKVQSSVLAQRYNKNAPPSPFSDSPSDKGTSEYAQTQ